MAIVAACTDPPDELTTVIVLVPVGVPGEMVLVTVVVPPPPHATNPLIRQETAMASNNEAFFLRLVGLPFPININPATTPLKLSDASNENGWRENAGS